MELRSLSSSSSSTLDNISTCKSPGLLLHSTPDIQDILVAAAASTKFSSEIRKLALQYVGDPTIPYVVIRDVWKHTKHETRPHLSSILRGAKFSLESPKPREKSQELKERLQKLQEEADWKEYKELVKDVAGHTEDELPFSSYKDQLGFGLHVVVTMFTGFMGGYFLFRSQLQNSPALHAAGGVLGLCVGMLVETLLFMVHSYQYEKASSKIDKRRPRLSSNTRAKSYSRENNASILTKKRQ
ncbi:hypothetical protein O6H91_14G006800 [Diphasiastrum complanatum]|uniref:Uncharacterized protein n=1 Tax=Diphasiastrum complanatum TaxID=34168 RepID=A0ACC2BLB2_DIPCM|nr:hypothetical protein O6H91_Y548400 [Diphasiastrum complanatum]KAJ7530512.1 hypothetical protein O6H91_14G006800 [Diphasiastrum complanatum]